MLTVMNDIRGILQCVVFSGIQYYSKLQILSQTKGLKGQYNVTAPIVGVYYCCVPLMKIRINL